jgi:hypothetical protein
LSAACCILSVFGLATGRASVQARGGFFDQQIFVRGSALKNVILGSLHTCEERGAVSWYFAQPMALDYDNTRHCRDRGTCLKTILYMEKQIPADPAGRLIPAETGLIDGPGTYLFIEREGRTERRYRLAVRRADDYVGYITELLGVPFVYAPTYVEGKGHQTDAGLGADCVAVVVYGIRREGRNVPYVGPSKLYDLMAWIGDSSSLENTHIQVGDVLHFGFQTAVISKDLPPIGTLNAGDHIIHSFHRYVEEVRFSDLPYGGMPFDILRWDMND